MWVNDRIASCQKAIRRFLRERECECVRASEELHRCLLSPGQQSVFSVYIHLPEECAPSFDRVDGLAIQDPDGAVCVLLPRSSQKDLELAARLKLRGNVYKIAGIMQDVRRLVLAVDEGEWNNQSFMLMRARGEGIPFGVAEEARGPTRGSRVVIRNATIEDLDALLSLHMAYEREELSLESTQAETEMRMTSLLRQQIVAIAFCGDEPIGKINTNARGYFYDQIGGFYVKPECRSMRVGGSLFFYLLHKIAAERRDPVLFVRHENVPAISVYRRAGFQPAGEYGMSTMSSTRRLS